MERRVFIKRTAVGLAAVAATGTSAMAASHKEGPKSKFNEKTNTVYFGSKKLKVSKEQKAAYMALPEELQAKLNPPKSGKLPTAEELKKIAEPELAALSTSDSRVRSTVMCPW